MKIQLLMLILGALSMLPLLGMALSADRNTERKDGQFVVLPVYRSVCIYAGGMVSINSSGYAIPAADTASTIFVGVAEETADNSAHATDGYINVLVRRTGCFKFAATSISQSHVGSIMYVKDDCTFDNTSSNLIPCGRLVEYISSTEGWIQIDSACIVGATIAASVVTFSDPNNSTTATDADGALAEIKVIADANKVALETAQYVIPVPLATVLEGDATNVIGYLTKDTTPKLDHINGDTDSCLAITWAASDSTPVVCQVVLPADVDTTKDIVFHCRAKEGVNTDHPVINLDSYFDEGDTKVEDATAAVTNTTWAEYTATIAAADVKSGAQILTVELTPGTHTTSNNTLLVSGIWFEASRKRLTS
jgi:hypothetical protein